jgi:hypothetical protein
MKKLYLTLIAGICFFALQAPLVPAADIPAAAQRISASTTSARNATAFGKYNGKLLIYCDSELWYKLGNSTVTATNTDHHLPPGMALVMDRGESDHLAVILGSGTATVYISEIR